MYILRKKKKIQYNTKKKWKTAPQMKCGKKKQFQYHWHNLHPRALTYLSLILVLLMLQYYFPYSQLSLWTNYTLLLSCRCYWKGQLLLLQINLVNYLDVAYHGQLKSYYWYYHYTVVIETEITLYFWMFCHFLLLLLCSILNNQCLSIIGETLQDERINGGAFVASDGVHFPHKLIPVRHRIFWH